MRTEAPVTRISKLVPDVLIEIVVDVNQTTRQDVRQDMFAPSCTKRKPALESQCCRLPHFENTLETINPPMKPLEVRTGIHMFCGNEVLPTSFSGHFPFLATRLDVISSTAPGWNKVPDCLHRSTPSALPSNTIPSKHHISGKTFLSRTWIWTLWNVTVLPPHVWLSCVAPRSIRSLTTSIATPV